MLGKPYAGKIPPQDELSLQQRSTFIGPIQTTLLSPGFILWRFVSDQKRNRFSDCWVDPETMKFIMQIFHSTGNFSEAYKKEVIMNHLGILEEWSKLSWRVQIILKKEVIAYVGEIETQKRFSDVKNEFAFGGPGTIKKVTETRLGRLVQYVIPRFKGLPDNNDWADLRPLVHI